MSDKTIDDVSIEEWGEFVEAANELIGAYRFMFWLSGDDDSDGSYMGTMQRMEKAFAAIGLPQPSYEVFTERVESMLKSGLPPDQWRMLHMDEASHRDAN